MVALSFVIIGDLASGTQAYIRRSYATETGMPLEYHLGPLYRGIPGAGTNPLNYIGPEDALAMPMDTATELLQKLGAEYPYYTFNILPYSYRP